MPDPIERVIRDAIDQQRMGNALTRDMVTILRRAFGSIAAEMARLDPTSVSARYQRARLDKLFKEVDGILKRAGSEQYALAKKELVQVGTFEASKAAATLSGAGAVGVKTPVHPALMRTILTADPIQGKLLRDWFKD